MNIKDISIVTLRILGIYCLIQAVLLLQGLVSVFTMSEEFNSVRSEMIIAALCPSIGLLFFGILLIAFSVKLSDFITLVAEDKNKNSMWSLGDVQSVLFSLAGTLIFAFAIPRTFTWISHLVSLLMNDSHGLPYNSKVDRDSWLSLILSGFQMLFGISLFLGGQKLSDFWQRMRK